LRAEVPSVEEPALQEGFPQSTATGVKVSVELGELRELREKRYA